MNIERQTDKVIEGKTLSKVAFDYSNALGFLREEEIGYLEPQVMAAHKALHSGSGAGSGFTGWVDLPLNYDREESGRVKQAAGKIISDSEVLVVIGIGGSYLGARAAIEMLSHTFYNMLPKAKRKTPEIYFAGNNLSPSYVSDLIDLIGDRDISLNVISKSGTTTEPAIAFRIFREHMEKKYGKAGAAARIYATTDKARGAMKKVADAEKYETFVIPDDVGGRYSVLTPVGLLPIAACGADIDAMMQGAADACRDCSKPDLRANDCYMYAAVRNALYRKSKTTEIMVGYEPSLHFLIEWWKQLFGESEGKDSKGLFPAGVDFTTDLHSMGQYIQDGLRNIFETVLDVQKPRKSCFIPSTEKSAGVDMDGLGFLGGRDIDYVNRKAMQGTILAHNDGGVPNLVVSAPEMNSYWFGQLVYFFEKACGISGYMMGVNPFDQPGVEAYKKNMFALLGKPGYEAEKAALEGRLAR